ncbi:DUF2726 domain-containing protein [Herbaspirillum huttiense]|uniref:DUF2726 domain-containing protein n=1 Tax=Herbaspirillum huttiense TaxID=863372 RepID=UPI0039B102D4
MNIRLLKKGKQMVELDTWQQLVVYLAIGIVFYVAYRRLFTSEYSAKNYSRMPLLTEHEKKCYKVLQEAIGTKLIIAPQVVFGAFIKVKGLALTDKNKARHKVAHNRGDFVICDRDFNVVALIELDDASHRRWSQRAKDARRDQLMKTVGVKAIRYRQIPSIKEVQRDLGL